MKTFGLLLVLGVTFGFLTVITCLLLAILVVTSVILAKCVREAPDVPERFTPPSMDRVTLGTWCRKERLFYEITLSDGTVWQGFNDWWWSAPTLTNAPSHLVRKLHKIQIDIEASASV